MSEITRRTMCKLMALTGLPWLGLFKKAEAKEERLFDPPGMGDVPPSGGCTKIIWRDSFKKNGFEVEEVAWHDISDRCFCLAWVRRPIEALYIGGVRSPMFWVKMTEQAVAEAGPDPADPYHRSILLRKARKEIDIAFMQYWDGPVRDVVGGA